MRHKKLIPLAILLLSFFQLFSEDYYWVGGQGIWSDLNSWRTVTGQIPNEVPDAEDNVIFNENSFLQNRDTVFILTGNPTCLNMTWENIQDTAVIVGGSNTSDFSIYGSLTFDPKVINEYQGNITFLSDQPGNILSCSETRFGGNIIFEGNGEWIVQDTLFVIDTFPSAWQVLFEGTEPIDWPINPVIIHNNGTFNSNEQFIVSRGFSTASDKTREVIIENTDFWLVGNWSLSGENLDFNAANSYIFIGGEMNNFAGELISYHDIDFLPVDGGINNTDIRTYMRKVHFLGSGALDGKKTPGIEGSFKIDTLLFDGAITMMGPIRCAVTGPWFDVWYTRVDLVHGEFEPDESFFHRVDFNGESYGHMLPSFIFGDDNEMDSIMFNVPHGKIAGSNLVNDILYYTSHGILSGWSPSKNTVNHAVFGGDGYFGGSNDIDLLTLNTGMWYQLASDSLEQPGSYYTNTNIQKVNQIEVIGDCYKGLSIFTSTHKETQAILNYTGAAYNTEYLMIQYIKNIGTILNVDNGINLGDNENIAFNTLLSPRTLYWVGGEGDWDDFNHWSLSSGGVGDQCPPTVLDDIFFDGGSGFVDSGMVVNVNVKHGTFNDMTWDGVTMLPTLSGPDSSYFHIHGSLTLSTEMFYDYWGDVYFESMDDDEYETIFMEYDYLGETVWDFLNKVYFYGRGGKWELTSRVNNYFDTTYMITGALLLENDTLSVLNFNAQDTLHKEIYLLEKTLVEVHQYQADAWVLNAYGYNFGYDNDTIFKWDAGQSLIRVTGLISPPLGAPPGFCNMRTYAGEVPYYNVEFSTGIEGMFPLRDMLISESKCSYHLVDYYCAYGDGVGNGEIDTLTFKNDPDFGAADGCKIRNTYEIDFVFAEAFGDTLIGNHIIDTAIFYQNGALYGYHDIGFLQAEQFMSMLFKNDIDTCVLHGNADILGGNTFSQLILSPNKRYNFQHETDVIPDTQLILDDFIVTGNCDAPIRMQSDSIGTHAKILYQRQNPTNTEYTAIYTSMRDMTMEEYEGIEYIAEESVDLGNNTNWIFTESMGEIYYWIGGSGDWGDWSHWSFESGGAPIDGECTPKEINTVVFDDNSFLTANDTVRIEVLNAYCRSMYWKHSETFKPTFMGGDTSVLFIYSSLILNDSIDYQYAGEIWFDQFEELGDIADTITSSGHTLLNDVWFKGINDVVYLADDMSLLDIENEIIATVFHEQGTVILNGNHMKAGRYYSVFKNDRTLNMENSEATVQFDFSRAWDVDGDNFNLYAHNSTLYNLSFMGTIMTDYGDYLEYYNVELNGPVDSLANQNNTVEYNVVSINMESGLVTGNFIADSILIKAGNSGIFKHSETNVVIIDGQYGSVNEDHKINRCFVNKFGFIRGHNEIEYCIFNDDGVFMGHNVFDTLVLYPGQGDFQNQGNWFYFQADSVQTVNDSLYIRGNQCSNINITSLNPPHMAWIQKDFGNFNVSCDYLNIYSVGAQSETLEFYAGQNSTPLPDPNDPPPGWIFDNAQGYIFGFDGATERFCLGDTYTIEATNFNGDPSTQYYWEGSQYPGGPTYTITEPGQYEILVQYFEGCEVRDFINVEGDFPPIASIDPGPFCEGDPINVYVSPDNGAYNYEWFNQETTSSIIADLSYNGGISVTVLDTTNGCDVTPNQTIIVKEAPQPEVFLGDDVTLQYGESITLDAGPGTTYSWSADPEPPNPIPNPDERYITVQTYSEPNPIVYSVLVNLDGCENTGSKSVEMYPPFKLGIPTAFSPNGDDVNDVLYVYGSGFMDLIFRVYNRYGELVFETNDKNIGWDGTVNGQKQELEVYTWYVKVTYQDGGFAEKTGNVTLLR